VKLTEDEAWESAPIRIGFAVQPEGNGGLPGAPGADPAADHGVIVGPGNRAELVQAAWLDPLPWLYGITHDYVEFDSTAMRPGSGVWSKPRQILNRPLMVPGVGPQPAEFADSSALQWGSGDPDADDFDARSLVMGAGDVLELRVPWALLGYADPSSHRSLRGTPEGTMEAVETGNVGITVQLGDAAPLKTAGYHWDGWNRARWRERRKAGWPALRDAFARTAAKGTAAPR
jgi:hypothetical protein